MNQWTSTMMNDNLPDSLLSMSKSLKEWADSSVGNLTKQVNDIPFRIDHIRESPVGHDQGDMLSNLESQLENILAVVH